MSILRTLAFSGVVGAERYLGLVADGWTIGRGSPSSCVMTDDPSAVVGRDAELAAIDGFLDAARTRFALLTLEGEPGIGKTTIWLEAVRRAASRGTRVLQTRPSEAEATLSYAALADLFDAVTDETISSLPSLGARRFRPRCCGRPRRPAGSMSERCARRCYRSCGCCQRRDRCVVAVDDAQWLDSPSARVLTYAVRRLEAEPIGVVVTARVDGTASTARFDRAAEPSRRDTIRSAPSASRRYTS